MTWNELAEKIAKMSPEQRETDVTIYVDDWDEFYGLTGDIYVNSPGQLPSYFSTTTDVLDLYHPFLAI